MDIPHSHPEIHTDKRPISFEKFDGEVRSLYAALQAARGNVEHAPVPIPSRFGLYDLADTPEQQDATYQYVKAVLHTPIQPPLTFDQVARLLQDARIFPARIPTEAEYLQASGVSVGDRVLLGREQGQIAAMSVGLWLIEPFKRGDEPYLSPRAGVKIQFGGSGEAARTYHLQVEENGKLKGFSDCFTVLSAADETTNAHEE